MTQMAKKRTVYSSDLMSSAEIKPPIIQAAIRAMKSKPHVTTNWFRADGLAALPSILLNSPQELCAAHANCNPHSYAADSVISGHFAKTYALYSYRFSRP